MSLTTFQASVPFLIGAIASSLSTSCARLPFSQTSQGPLVPLSAQQCVSVLSGDEPSESLRRAARVNLRYLERRAAGTEYRLLNETVRGEDLWLANEMLLQSFESDRQDWAREVCNRLTPVRLAASEPPLLTGYYRPVVAARREPSSDFRYPLYGPPKDLVRVEGSFYRRTEKGGLLPYPSRAEIDAGALNGKAEVLAWLDDPVELFFLHVQGSGVLRFDDGTTGEVSYAASNGRPYRSIGRLLVERGKLRRDRVTMQSLKQYLREHTGEQDEILRFNERYVFFRFVLSGPLGSLDLPLTALRSVAADPAHYPPGAMMFIRVLPPIDPKLDPEPIQKLVFVQDAGAAITGPGRLDLFAGTGDRAADLAGHLRARAEIYVLLPRRGTSLRCFSGPRSRETGDCAPSSPGCRPHASAGAGFENCRHDGLKRPVRCSVNRKGS